MKAKFLFSIRLILLSSLIAAFPLTTGRAAENVLDAIALVRSTYAVDRQAFLAENLLLNDSEAEAFWPLYREYRADMEKLGDSLVKLVLAYADVYPDVPEDQARQMLKDYSALQEKLVRTRNWYLKRAAKSLPATKVLRWAQLENRLDLVLRLQLAGQIPLAPAPRPNR